MQRVWLNTVAAGLVVTALFAGPPVRAGGSPFVGNWKLHDVSAGAEPILVLLQVVEKDGKLEAKSLGSPLLGDASIEKFQADAKSMKMEVRFKGGSLEVKGYAAKGDAKPKDVLGSIMFNNRLINVRFTRTEDTELDAKEARGKLTDDGKALNEARVESDADKKQEALKELLEKYGDKPSAYPAAQMLLQLLVKQGAKDAELRSTAERYLKIGAAYGPEVEAKSLLTVCQTLTKAAKVSPLAVDYARKAEQGLPKNVGAGQQAAVLKALVSALKKTGQDQAAKEVEPRLARIEETLDAEFAKTSVPFTPEVKKARSGPGKRVALVELFTGAYCPPCVAADIAFDAVLKSYERTDVIMLQYHMHIPAPDRLTNADTEARWKYYVKKGGGVPSAFLNGAKAPPLGGGKLQAEGSYDRLCGAIDKTLDTDAAVTLKAAVERKGDQLDLSADVTRVKEGDDKLTLRFVLMEEVVRYPGGNGQRLHHHVVRAMPGGADGLELKEPNAKLSASVNLGELRKTLDAYMTKFDAGSRPFLDDEHPLHLDRLKVVAFVQNDESKEILQAVQVEVPNVK